MPSMAVGMRKLFRVGIALALLGGVRVPALSAQDEEIPTAIQPREDGRVAVLVELIDPPAARVYGEILRSANGSKAAAARAGADQVRKILPKQQQLMASLSPALQAVEIYRVQKAYNGVALGVEASQLGLLRRAKGVRAVHVLVPEYPTNSTSVPFLGVPNVWRQHPRACPRATGDGDHDRHHRHRHRLPARRLRRHRPARRLPRPTTATVTTTVGAGRFPTAKVVGGIGLRRRRLHRRQPAGARPEPDGLLRPRLPRRRHRRRASASTAAGTTYTGAVQHRHRPLRRAAHRPRRGPAGAALRPARLRLQRLDRPHRPGDRLGDRPERRQRPVRPPRRDQHVARLRASAAPASTQRRWPPTTPPSPASSWCASAGNSGDTYFITGSPGAASARHRHGGSLDTGVAGAVLTVNSPARDRRQLPGLGRQQLRADRRRRRPRARPPTSSGARPGQRRRAAHDRRLLRRSPTPPRWRATSRSSTAAPAASRSRRSTPRPRAPSG